MTGYTPPAALPQHVLQRADVRDAIARHDFGTVFFLARKWGGISYSKIADSCAMKPERVGKIARGESSITTYEKIGEVADGLRIPGSLLGLAPRPWEVLGSPTAASSSGGAVGDEGKDVKRREFLGVSLAVAGSAMGLSNLASPGRIGPGFIRRLRARSARLRKLDDFLGGGDTYRVYLDEFRWTTKLLKNATYSESTWRELLSLNAEQAQQAGWAAFDAGLQNEARELFQTALSMAEEGRDHALTGNALALLAYQNVSIRCDKPSAELARASTEAAGPDVHGGVSALLLERRAFAHAVAHEATETERVLALAQEALQRCGDSTTPEWASWVDETELGIMTGRCWAELGRPLRAVPALEGALAHFDDTCARDKALYMTWLADAYIDAQEIEQAAAVTARALELCAGVASVRPQKRLAMVAERLQQHRTLPAVADVIDSLNTECTITR